MDHNENSTGDEQEIGRLLRAAGRRKQLPETRKRSWETHFRAELEQVTQQRRRRRHRRAGLLAAGVAALAIAVSQLAQKPAPASPLIQVSSVTGNAQLIDQSGNRQPLVAGHRLEVNSTITTGNDSWASVAYAGYDVRINSGSRIELHQRDIALHDGELFASDKENRIGQIQLNVITPHGRVRDIGTQFTVIVGKEGTTTTVRRGTVIVTAGKAEYKAQALPGIASRVTIDPQQRMQSDQVPPTGEGWRWIYRASPGYELEGRSAFEFLSWAVNESGLELSFTTSAAKAYARRTTLHGDYGPLNPETAVASVLASTDLTATREGNSLKVELRE